MTEEQAIITGPWDWEPPHVGFDDVVPPDERRRYLTQKAIDCIHAGWVRRAAWYAAQATLETQAIEGGLPPRGALILQRKDQ